MDVKVHIYEHGSDGIMHEHELTEAEYVAHETKAEKEQN